MPQLADEPGDAWRRLLVDVPLIAELGRIALCGAALVQYDPNWAVPITSITPSIGDGAGPDRYFPWRVCSARRRSSTSR